jgi:hypothetical protein
MTCVTSASAGMTAVSKAGPGAARPARRLQVQERETQVDGEGEDSSRRHHDQRGRGLHEGSSSACRRKHMPLRKENARLPESKHARPATPRDSAVSPLCASRRRAAPRRPAQ